MDFKNTPTMIDKVEPKVINEAQNPERNWKLKIQNITGSLKTD